MPPLITTKHALLKLRDNLDQCAVDGGAITKPGPYYNMIRENITKSHNSLGRIGLKDGGINASYRN